MYKSVFITLFTSLSILSVKAQSKFNFGASYGVNISQITDPVLNEDFKIGHLAELNVSYKLNNRLKVKTGLGYLNTGSASRNVKLIYPDGYSSSRNHFYQNYNYLLIPLHLNVSLNKFYVEPGISFAFNLKNVQRTVLDEGGNRNVFVNEISYFGQASANPLTLPLSLTFGRNFTLNQHLQLGVGINAFYSLNRMMKSAPNDLFYNDNLHYYGGGFKFTLSYL